MISPSSRMRGARLTGQLRGSLAVSTTIAWRKPLAGKIGTMSTAAVVRRWKWVRSTSASGGRAATSGMDTVSPDCRRPSHHGKRFRTSTLSGIGGTPSPYETWVRRAALQSSAYSRSTARSTCTAVRSRSSAWSSARSMSPGVATTRRAVTSVMSASKSSLSRSAFSTESREFPGRARAALFARRMWPRSSTAGVASGLVSSSSVGSILTGGCCVTYHAVRCLSRRPTPRLPTADPSRPPEVAAGLRFGPIAVTRRPVAHEL